MTAGIGGNRIQIFAPIAGKLGCRRTLMMPAVSKSKYRVQAGWDDVPHLDEETKEKLRESTPPHLRDARTKGIPSLGAGAIYITPEDEIKVDPFKIPSHWPRVFGLDVGWKKTAAIFGAWDRDSDIIYLYTEHYRGKELPSVHADAIKARGDWIPGVIDPASRGAGQRDGEILMEIYMDLGLDLEKADNAVEAGIYAVAGRLATGRMKVFSTCQSWFAEYRLYRRSVSGQPIKSFDHLMDATRYLVVSGLQYAIVEPFEKSDFLVSVPVGDRKAGY